MSIVELAAWIIVITTGVKLLLVILKGIQTGWERVKENHL